MRIDASKLEWHDAGVDGTNYEDGTRTIQWKVEVFRWDIGDRGDAQFSTGQLGLKLCQEQEKGISRGRNTSQRAFLPTESPGQDIPSHNSRR